MCIITNSVNAYLLLMFISIFDHALTHPQDKPFVSDGFTWFFGANPLRITLSERQAVNSAVTNNTNRIRAEDTDLVDSKITFELIVAKDRILGAHYFGIKRFDSKSIDVFIRNSLMEGYRTIDTYQLRVVAYDASKRMNNAYKDVILTILRNEGTPKWTHFLDTVSMREDISPEDTIVAQVNAADSQDNDTVTYRIQDEKAIRANISSPSHYFLIQEQRGLVKLKKSVFGTDIDSFEVTIQACDGGIPQKCVQRLMTVKVSKDHLPPQFSTGAFRFIMTENEGVGYQIGKIISTDSQPLGHTVYELIGAPTFFEVNGLSGDLVLKKSLRNDYDVEYKFKVRAYDTGEPLYISTANVTVETRRNIFGPEFDTPAYAKTVHETFPVGGTLFVANATDSEKDPLIFSLRVDPEDTDFFYIDSTTGIIKLAKSLFNQTKTKFKFFVQARDQRCVDERSITAPVDLNVYVDSAPSFNSSTDILPLSDTATRGDVVHTLRASDTDLKGYMTYKLVGRSPAPYLFSVDPRTGDITLLRDIMGSELTLETYTLEVEAYDSLYPKRKAKQTLNVNVTVSAGDPGCPSKDTYNYKANEYVTPESLVGTLFAKGSDGGTSEYSLIGDRNRTAYVYTDPTTGAVKHTKSIVNPPKTKLTIIMTVQMVKDHYLPPIDADPFGFFMGENEGAGYNIGTIDFNRTNGGALVYELIYAPKFFELNRRSGQLSLKESLRTDFSTVYEFGVRAYEASKSKRIYVAKANVTVRVFRNDNVPIFTLNTYQKPVPETFQVGQMLIDTKAADADGIYDVYITGIPKDSLSPVRGVQIYKLIDVLIPGPGDTLVYSLAGNPNDTAMFYIDPATGAIYLAKSLVNAPKTKFQLRKWSEVHQVHQVHVNTQFTVEARDQRCVNEKRGTAPVIINVIFDSAPDFVSSTVIPPLKDTAKLGDVVHTLRANDTDLDGTMTYELAGQPPAPYMFSVDPITGVITLSRDISGLEKIDNYTLDVVAYDSSFPNKKAKQTLNVKVTMSPGAPKNKPDASYRFQRNDTTLNNLHKQLLTIRQLLKPYVSEKHTPK